MSIRQYELLAKQAAQGGDPGPLKRLRRERAIARARRVMNASFKENSSDGRRPAPTKGVKSPTTLRSHPRKNPGELSAVVTRAVCEGIRLGNRLPVASRMVGVNPIQAKSWYDAGKGTDPEKDMYGFFREQVEIARADAEASSVDMIKKSRHWAAHLAWLERRYPQEWGKPNEQAPDPDRPMLVPVLMIPRRDMERALSEPTVVLEEDEYDIE